MKTEQLIAQLIELNEMDMTMVLEALKYHIEEKSHFPRLINKVFDIDEMEYEVAIEKLVAEVEDLKEKVHALTSGANE